MRSCAGIAQSGKINLYTDCRNDRNHILRDILLEEEWVPSTNELAKLYAINPATAAKGVNLLVDEGILYKKRGIGMFVAEGAKKAIQKRRKENFFKTYVQGMLIEAASLGITKEDLIDMITTEIGEV